MYPNYVGEGDCHLMAVPSTLFPEQKLWNNSNIHPHASQNENSKKSAFIDF